MIPSQSAIEVQNLSKTFLVPEREGGLKASLYSLVRRKTRPVKAVDDISFEIGTGEVVGFLGPNGAGKTTTLKLLSGLLYPTSGQARILGHIPSQREKDYLQQITLVMGQRSQLAWDIPALDSFELNRAIFAIPAAPYRQTRDELIDLLELKDIVRKPVRNLSLGERMKCELIAALLHRPRVLFLDEPTIGVDVTMQRRIREFIHEYNRRTGATVLLTSHYMADVQALCRRVLVIHHGRLVFDGDLSQLVDRVTSHKTIIVTLAKPCDHLDTYGQVVSQTADRVTLHVEKADTSRVTARVLADLPVTDLVVQDPPIEEVVERVFAQEG